jgi:hypothetical protein
MPEMLDNSRTVEYWLEHPPYERINSVWASRIIPIASTPSIDALHPLRHTTSNCPQGRQLVANSKPSLTKDDYCIVTPRYPNTWLQPSRTPKNGFRYACQINVARPQQRLHTACLAKPLTWSNIDLCSMSTVIADYLACASV